jgi:hypothetical protein
MASKRAVVDELDMIIMWLSGRMAQERIPTRRAEQDAILAWLVARRDELSGAKETT